MYIAHSSLSFRASFAISFFNAFVDIHHWLWILNILFSPITLSLMSSQLGILYHMHRQSSLNSFILMKGYLGKIKTWLLNIVVLGLHLLLLFFHSWPFYVEDICLLMHRISFKCVSFLLSCPIIFVAVIWREHLYIWT